MKSKLEELFDDESFAIGAISHDNGFLINDYGDMVDYVALEYENRWDVYLNHFDEGDAPYRNILVKATSEDKEGAKEMAMIKLKLEYGNRIH